MRAMARSPSTGQKLEEKMVELPPQAAPPGHGTLNLEGPLRSLSSLILDKQRNGA